jgi:chaperonin cofactor prefoldin
VGKVEKPIQLGLTTDETAELEAAIDDLLAEMKRAAKQMKSDQAQIERLKAETRAMLAELKAA